MTDPPRRTLESPSTETLWRDVHGRVRASTGSSDRADDIVQETFLLALRHPPPAAAELRAWLIVVARNVARRLHRRESNRRQREREIAAARGASSEAPSPAEQREALGQLARLDEPYRAVLHLRYVEGYEVEAIARLLGRSPGTVRSQIKRGLDRVRERMGGPPRSAKRRAVGLAAALAELLRSSPIVARASAVLATVGACAALWLLWPDRRAAARARATVAAEVVERPGTAQAAREAVPEGAPGVADSPDAQPATLAGEPWPMDLRGVVRDDLGRPRGGVAVYLGRAGGAEGEQHARSDAFGRFRLLGADGRAWIWAAEGERAPSSRHLVASVDPDSELELRLGPERDATRGRVVDAEGMAVAGATIWVGGRTLRPANPDVGEQGTLELPRPAERILADERGSFLLPVRPGDLARLHVFAAGHPPLSGVFRSPEGGAWLDLALERPAILTGRLLTPAGIPAAAAPLRLLLPGPLPEVDAFTDAEGRFRLAGLPLGRFELALAGEPLADASSFHMGATIRAGETRELELRCRREHTLRGRAEDLGQPLAGWTVELERLRSDWFPERRRTRTDADGCFAFASCAQDEPCRLRLIDPATQRVAASLRAIPGEEEVRLARASRREGSAEIEGWLPCDAEHPPVFVELWSEVLGQSRTARVDPVSGRFFLGDLAPAVYRVRAWMRGAGPRHFGHVSPAACERLRFEPHVPRMSSWELHLALPADVPPGSVQVHLALDSMLALHPRTLRRFALDERGALAARLPPGEYEYSILIDGTSWERRSVRLAPGALTRESHAVEPAIPVTLELELPRPFGERERVVLIAAGDSEVCIPLPGGMEKVRDRFEVLLPPATKRLRVESHGGLSGEWDGVGGLQPHATIAVALHEPAR